MPVKPRLQRIRSLFEEGRFQEAFDESHKTGQHFQGAMLMLKHNRSHYAMELLKKSGNAELMNRGAKLMERQQLPDTAAALYEEIGKYMESGKAALQYGRPDWAVEMFEKAGEHEEGARLLSLKGNRAWGAWLLRKGGFESEADKMEGKAAKRDIKTRDAFLEEKFAESARQSAWRRKTTPFRRHSFAVMFFLRGGDKEKAVGQAFKAGKADWLVPIAELTNAPKAQIAKWAEMTARKGNHAVAAELYEMAGDRKKAGDSAMNAGKYLWAARVYREAGLTLMAGRARRATALAEKRR